MPSHKEKKKGQSFYKLYCNLRLQFHLIFFIKYEFKQIYNRITFSSYFLYARKIFRRLKISSYIINQLFKLQVFVV